MKERLASRHIVLLGVGHTNAHIVRRWGMNPIPDADLTCISDNPVATYSGMLPAVLAGQNSESEMQIDLVKLCGSVGARLLTNEVTGLDHESQMIHFVDRPSVPFDVLSIGIGSVPTTEGVVIESNSLLKIKPMQTFLFRLEEAVHDAQKRLADKTETASPAVDGAPATSVAGERKLNVVVVGSGVAGMEITFCLPTFLNKQLTIPHTLQIVTRSKSVLPGTSASMQRRVRNELKRRQVPVTTSRSVTHVTGDTVTLDDGTKIAADIVIWATGAVAPALLSKLDVTLDDRGFIATDNTLRSRSPAPVFAVGDSGTIVSEKLPKAGVYAVRQGPVLWENIQRTLDNRPLQNYQPQRSFLKLLNTGDGNAIGEWKGFSFTGRWVMRWKDRIDSKFMQMYRVSDDMMSETQPMQCRGCGCKLGGDVLEGALSVVSRSSADGTESLDDAAVIEMGKGQIVASTDFFSSPVDDLFLAGRIAALHSASDLVAMGASVKAALANVVVPDGDPKSQRQGLNDILEGARSEFSTMGGEIVGGHTIVGDRWELGFTVIGDPLTESLLRKQNLQIGDVLYMTKPLGIGVLLAARMRDQCAAHDYQSVIEVMLQPQHEISRLAIDLGITAGTDITGFGLVGHLLEMLTASKRSARLSLSKIELLAGAAEAFNSGIESSLAPANRHVECQLEATDEQRGAPEYAALFDPQTCGGLLFGIRPQNCGEFESRLSESCGVTAIRIGEICESATEHSSVKIV